MTIRRAKRRAKTAQRKRLVHRLLVLHFMTQLSLSEDADRRLENRGMGRVHHRILYFAYFAPGIAVSDLLSVLNVRPQNIQRPLRELIRAGYVFTRRSPRDGRVKRLYSSRKGDQLLAFVGREQRERVGRAFDTVMQRDVEGYFKVMNAMLGPDRRGWVERLTSLVDPTEVA
jgi:DNA-binding MarR family transcriptional regulator